MDLQLRAASIEIALAEDFFWPPVAALTADFQCFEFGIDFMPVGDLYGGIDARLQVFGKEHGDIAGAAFQMRFYKLARAGDELGDDAAAAGFNNRPTRHFIQRNAA